MKPLEERKADRLLRRKLAEQELSPAPKSVQPQDQVNLESFTVAELRKLAADQGIVVTGTKKADFIAALSGEAEQSENLTSEQTSLTPPPPPPPPGGQPWSNQ